MADKISIKLAKTSDSAIISDLATKTFFDTYENKLNPKDMGAYTKNNFNAESISKEIKSKTAWYFLIYENNKLIGYSRLKWDKTPNRFKGLKSLEIDKLYLLKNKRNNGLGSIAVEKIKTLAKKHGYNIIWLRVWEHNVKALNFYKKLGFVEIENVDFKFAGKILNDYLLAINI
jgi:ribosomal protein S18 acetylase RimI-like enzyme